VVCLKSGWFRRGSGIRDGLSRWRGKIRLAVPRVALVIYFVLVGSPRVFKVKFPVLGGN